MTTRSGTACLLLAVGLSVPAWAATDTSRITAADLGTGQARVIVKFRSADAATAVADEAPADLAQLVDRTGVPMRQQRQITPRMRVVELDVVNTPGSVGAAIDRLRQDPRVQYAELDRHRRLHLAPNDPGFLPGNANGQWYLRFDSSTPSATDAMAAWDITTGTIAHNASAATVKTALVALDDGYSASDWTVTGSAGGPYTVTTPGGALTGSSTGLTEGTFAITAGALGS